ncbi:MAG: hypothetical protein GQ474_00645, partial [Sulfurimonas sp.]|nr:hypothetical protein [Sulfurimonas sp.]
MSDNEEIKIIEANINDEPELASRLNRFFAACIDMIIMVLLISPIIYFTGAYEGSGKNVESSFIFNLLMMLSYVFIYLIINGKLLIKNGQTIGKKILNIKIVDLNNNVPTKIIFLKRYGVFFLVGDIPVVGSWLSIINILF